MTTETQSPQTAEEAPQLECTACKVEPNVDRWGNRDGCYPWRTALCGPHRVDWLRDEHGMRVVPKRYEAADPAHLVPQIRQWDGERSVFLTGPVGTGKTHQAAALVRSAYRLFDPPVTPMYTSQPDMRQPNVQVGWYNVPRLLEDLRRSFNFPDMAPEGMETKPLVVLDDIGAEKPSEWVEERLYCIVNERYEDGLPLIVTSNLTPTQLAGQVGARLASRLREMCDLVGLRGDDRRLKKAPAA